MNDSEIKIGKRELRIMRLAQTRSAETSAEATIDSLQSKGLVEVEDRWLLTCGLTGGRAGSMNYCFRLTEIGREVLSKFTNASQ